MFFLASNQGAQNPIQPPGGFDVNMQDDLQDLQEQIRKLTLRNAQLAEQVAQCQQLAPQLTERDPVGRKDMKLIFINESFKFDELLVSFRK